MLLFSLLLPLHAGADEMNLHMNFDYANSSSKTTNAGTGNETESQSSSFSQQYNIDLSKTIYPYLSLLGGGSFDLDSSTTTSDEIETEREDWTIRPYIELNLKNPLYSAGIGYHSSERKEDITGLPSTRNFKKDWNAAFKWSPVGLPHMRLFYYRTNTYDDAGTVDSLDQQTTLKLGYIALRKLPINYTYRRSDSENKISDFKILRQTHDGNIGYSRSFFNRRLFMDLNYKIKYITAKLPGGNKNLESPILPSAGLFSSDDTPLDGPALIAVTALIDGNVTASSGINIGWTDASESDRNIALDFGISTSVDKIFVYVDRNIPSNISSSFVWTVYTSPDNTDTSTWTSHVAVASASFGVFQNRFEISFADVKTRFIKVVTSPLSSAFTGNTALENIFITEIGAFVTTISQQEEELVSIDHNAGFNLRGNISDNTVIGYNFFSALEDADPSTEKTAFSNGVYLNHRFNTIFSLSTRFNRDDRESTVEGTTDESVDYTYTALAKAAYMETFQQILSYSNNRLTENAGTSISNSVFLRNNAKLYEGWDTFIDLGYSWSTPLEGGKTTVTSTRVGSSIVPNNKITLDLNYTATKQTQENGSTSTFNQSVDGQLMYIPYRTLSLFARVIIEDSDRVDELKIFQDYLLNWAPFPDGDLQLSFTFNETLRLADEQEETAIGPGLKWDINRYAFLDMSFFYTMVKSKLITTDSTTFKTTFRVSF